MEINELKEIAAQLRKPSGELGLQIGEFMNKGNVQMHHDTIRTLHATGEEHILEIGMGNGFFVKEILEPNSSVKYTGCDYSVLMVSEACKMNQDYVASGRAQFLHATAGSLPFSSQTFDKIFTINTIYFWEHPPLVLQQLHHLLKPEGNLIIAFRPERQMKNYPFANYGFQLYSKEAVKELLLENSFEVTEVHENQEPDFDLKGELMKMENTVIVCRKAQ